MGFAVKLDTNGTHPALVKDLAARDLVQYIAMDIKNAPDRYAGTAGVEDPRLEAVRETAAFLLEGRVPYEFRTTVVKELHRREDIEAMGRWMAGDDKFFLQCFKDSGDILKPGLSAYSDDEMKALCDVFKAYVPKASLRGL
jgi:pyruvate formate lyase activating enzyme